jgi:hypothetical protein
VKVTGNLIEEGISLLKLKWAPYHHGMTRREVVDGSDGLQVWRVAANILN